MALGKRLASATLVIGLGGCSTTPLMPEPLPPNSLRAQPDYYQLVVEPRIQIPADKRQCQLRNPENDPWLGWVRDAWLGAQDHNFFVGVSISHAGQSGLVQHEIPVFHYRTKSFGGGCEVSVNYEMYQSSLFRMDNMSTFSVTALSSTQRRFDTTAFRIASDAAKALAVWNGTPEFLAAALGKSANLALESVSFGELKMISTQQVGLARGLDRQIILAPLSFNTGAGPINISVDAYLSPVASALKPHVEAVPDFSRMPAQYALNWQIAGRALPATVDFATSGKWALYAQEADTDELDRLCSAVQRDLIVKGFSSSDAAIMAWVMTQTHPDASSIALMTNPECLKDKQRELSRFGVSTAVIVDTAATLASSNQTTALARN